MADTARRWLTVKQVTAMLHAAGYPDSLDTVRRGIDAGDYGQQGADWYRTERGRYRMVAAAAVDRLIARRKHAEPRGGPIDSGGPVVGDGTWLTIGEVLARLRAAGYTESESTVRRMIDEGAVESYRIERGGHHRRIRAASVDQFIAQRKNPGAGLPPRPEPDPGE